jgi:hypothetical protein
VYEEKKLLALLTALQPKQRAAFAAAAATRQLRNFERAAQKLCVYHEKRPREIAIRLWQEILGERPRTDDWENIKSELLGLLPEESADAPFSLAIADDAVASLVYAINCYETMEPQEGAYAARRSYDAADQAVIRILNAQPGNPQSEQKIRSHPVVTREIERQRVDLVSLTAGRATEVMTRSLDQPHLTDEEALTVD